MAEEQEENLSTENPQEAGSEIETQEDEEVATNDNSGGGGLASPEGILMLFVAILIDGLGFIIFLLGTWFAIDDYGVLDILGMLVIGGWMFFRSGGLKGEAVKKGTRRFITSSVVEVVPFLGGLSPTWTWLVYKTLKDG